jgi:serine/threonine-protein kinase
VTDRWPEARRLFEALADAPETEQGAELARLAAADPPLARLVAELLAADRRASGPLEQPVAAPLDALSDEGDGAEENESEATLAGEVVGPWRLVARIGRGGMGEVWAGERADGQFEQGAAVKLVRRGLGSDEILARFVRERQILAGLSHPNVARLLDGGRAPDGRPYLAMELVEGLPITEHCIERALPVEERLDLFLAACEAVAAAHQRLIVHRDLKPSNIFVTAAGEVKLLDFGIAKLLDTGDEEGDLTRHGGRPLTPRYAAPEQLRGAPATTAADVYSLGAVLYELLTGGPGHRAKDSTPGDLVAGLERETVERPSQALLRGGDGDARTRQRAARRLTGDLDTIALTSLHADPERRYASVAALAEDVRRHLAGRPIAARPDSLGYRASKFVSRHRFGVAAGALALAALIAALSLALFQAQRAERAAADAAVAARRAERVKEFLIGLFEVADPEQSGGLAVSASDLVEQAGARLEVELGGEPELLSDLLEAVARIDRSLGRLDAAATLAQRARDLRGASEPGDHPALASADATLGAVRLSQGRLDEAAALLSAAIARLEAIEPAGSLLVARVRSDQSNVLFLQGKIEAAEREERAVYETFREQLGAGSVQTAIHLRNVGVLLDELDRLDEAEAAYRQSQQVLVQALGPEHANVAQSYLNLAVLLERRGQLEEAEDLFRRALAIRRERLATDHPATAQTLQLYALFLLRRDRLDESESLYREALAIFARINPSGFEVGKCKNGLALLASKRGDPASAARLLVEVEALFRAQLGEGHPFTWQVRGNRAEQLVLLGRLDEAEAIQREVLAHLRELTGPESEESRQAEARLARTLERRGAPAPKRDLSRRSDGAAVTPQPRKA